ncbi:MAG: cobalt-precorrin-5B (C(1))-methyltransferase [Nitrospirae bacterium]|nr:cobalt-precorrin-5B (C(1))-methyltransferase [Nitrospirota bacterium]
MKKNLRSGYTTGACAAAAAKAAALLVMRNALCVIGKKSNGKPVTRHALRLTDVKIPFPDGSRHKFKIHNTGYRMQDKIVRASVIKDAGDDPDVTNGAEIVAEVRLQRSGVRGKGSEKTRIFISGGKGVGIVTKPGLAVPVGEPAINPVPRKMIEEAVMEAIKDSCELRVRSYELTDKKDSKLRNLEVTISVINGEELAKKTLNHRLGIVGGISILGTTGIVKPVSTEAWTATITSSMDVARAMGHREIVLSSGRTSEKAHMMKFNFPEECYVMMGDYLEFSLLEAKKHRFGKIHLCAQWAKMLKIAMATPQTHVRHGAIDLKQTVEFLRKQGQCVSSKGQGSRVKPACSVGRGQGLLDGEFNTAHEIFDCINSSPRLYPSSIFSKVSSAAKKYAEGIMGGISVIGHLVSYDGEVIISCD